MSGSTPKIILATRKSPLALKQADLVSSVLEEKMGSEVETLPLSTTGDKRLEWSLEQEGGKGLFTNCLLYTSPSPRDATLSRMPSSA